MKEDMNLHVHTKTTHHDKVKLPKQTFTTHFVFPTQPPKPPCWQDFVGKSQSSDSKLSLSSSDVDTRRNRSGSGSHKRHKKHVSSSHSSSHKKKTTSQLTQTISTSRNSKLKRTQSEPCLSEKEVPSSLLLRYELSREQAAAEQAAAEQEAREYLKVSYAKCSQWLAQLSPPYEATDSLQYNSRYEDEFRAFEAEFSSLEVSTEDNISEKKRHSLDSIPE